MKVTVFNHCPHCGLLCTKGYKPVVHRTPCKKVGCLPGWREVTKPELAAMLA